LPEVDKSDVDEALIEHLLVKTLIEKFESLTPEADGFGAAFKVLSENVRHNVEEEEGELFSELRKMKIDLAVLGEQLLERKGALMAKLPTDLGDRT
jgi:hypothetical protein